MTLAHLQRMAMNAHIQASRIQAPSKPQTTNAPSNVRVGNQHADFKQLLDQELNGAKQTSALNFSKHAALRMQQRGLQLDASQMQKLDQAVNKAAAKGAKDALVLMNDQAYIVNIKQRTVITAMDANELQDHVVTQIDSAVIVPATHK